MKACISEAIYGTLADGQNVKRFLLRNRKGTEAIFTNLGASWIGYRLHGTGPSLVLGCETFEAFAKQGAFLGATIGRYANRIKNGQFELSGHHYQVEVNQPPHHLHGGKDNFSRKVWHSHITLENDETPVLTLNLSSPDGDAGFPGNVDTTVRITLDDDDQVHFHYSATTDKQTILNLTNHVYFNLSGQHAGSLAQHQFKVASNSFLQADKNGIPTGELLPVVGTALDLTNWREIAPALESLADPVIKQTNGFDQCYCFENDREIKLLAQARHMENGIELTCYSDLPGMQFYTGNYLGGTPINAEDRYPSYGGFCLEPGFWTDSPNHDHFPACVIDPNNDYSAIITYSFKKTDENK